MSESTAGNYLKSDLRATPPADTLKEISNVRNGELKGALRAVAAFGQDGLRRAWSHHMSLQCGLHFWPDANHRTAVVSFNLALERAFGWNLGMPRETALEMIASSKAFRRANRPMMTIGPLQHVTNSYGVFFQSYEPKLIIKSAVRGAGLY